MKKLVLPLVMSVIGAGAIACPDGMKSMDAKAPASHKMALSEQPAWSQARTDTAKAKPAKLTAKPAVASVTTEAKKAPGV